MERCFLLCVFLGHKWTCISFKIRLFINQNNNWKKKRFEIPYLVTWLSWFLNLISHRSVVLWWYNDLKAIFVQPRLCLGTFWLYPSLLSTFVLAKLTCTKTSLSIIHKFTHHCTSSSSYRMYLYPIWAIRSYLGVLW